MNARNNSTSPRADRIYSVTVDGVGQVFASDSLYDAVKEMKARGAHASLVFARKFVAFVDHAGIARPTCHAHAGIAAEL